MLSQLKPDANLMRRVFFNSIVCGQQAWETKKE